MESRFAGKNQSVVGMPRHGKSHFTVENLKKHPYGTLYVNPKVTKDKSPFVLSDSRHKRSQIINCLKAGAKLEYRLKGSDPSSGDELAYIIDGLLDAGFSESKPIILVIDEIHYYKNAKKIASKIEELAAVGVSLGVSSVFISQRFATIPYTAVSLCEDLYFFRMGALEKDYVTNKKLPYDEIMSRIDANGKYSYCIWDSERGLKGAFKE